VATLVLAAAWTWYATDRPSQHGWTNLQERQLIEPGEARSQRAAGQNLPPVASLLRNRSLVWVTISYAAVGYFEYLFFYWIEYYFEGVLKLGIETSRLYSTICTLAMGAGMFLGGWLSDRLQLQLGTRRGRPLVPVGGMIASAVLLGLGILIREPVWIVTCFALALAAVGACEGPFWITAIELGGRRGGTAAAICNTGGNAGGLVAPVLTPFLSDIIGW